MKKAILLTACVAATFGSTAQIPNSSFENWSTVGSYSNPDNWSTINAMTSPMSVLTAEKGTPGNPGSTYLKLTSKTVTGMGVMPGIATTGTIDMANMQITGGFAYAMRPLNLTGAWQYMAMSGTDKGNISVFLTKWNSTTMKHDTVAYANKDLTGMVMSWANFTIPLTYNNTSTPDTALIIMTSSGGFSAANDSYLWTDNLAFTGSNATAISNINNSISNITLFPNPAKGALNVICNIQVSGNYYYQITDILGKVLSTQKLHAIQGENQFSIDIQKLAAGVYSFSLNNGTQSSVQKFVVQ